MPEQSSRHSSTKGIALLLLPKSQGDYHLNPEEKTTINFITEQHSESKQWSACHHTLSPGMNGPLQGEWATHHVQPCLLDMECFSMMAVRRSSEKRWSRFSWPAVCPLMWGDAVDGCGWCESWKLFHRSRLYRKDHQRSQSQRGWVCQKTWDVTDF